MNCQHREKHRVDVKMINTDRRYNENQGSDEEAIIEYFPVYPYKSYPKLCAGDVGFSPSLNFLGMMILIM